MSRSSIGSCYNHYAYVFTAKVSSQCSAEDICTSTICLCKGLLLQMIVVLNMFLEINTRNRGDSEVEGWWWREVQSDSGCDGGRCRVTVVVMEGGAE